VAARRWPALQPALLGPVAAPGAPGPGPALALALALTSGHDGDTRFEHLSFHELAGRLENVELVAHCGIGCSSKATFHPKSKFNQSKATTL
jgi:hypothetical protein